MSNNSNNSIDNSPAADFIRDACDEFLRTMPSISEDMGKVIEEEKTKMLKEFQKQKQKKDEPSY
jgi:hypothetical protein